MTTLLSVLVKADRVDEAFQLLEDMRSRGAPPNSITYASLITACLKKRDVDRAMIVFDATEYELDDTRRPIRDCIVLGALVTGLCRLGSEEHVHIAADMIRDLFDQVRVDAGDNNVNNLRPTVNLMNAIVQGYVQHGLLEEAEQWLAMMRRQRIRPTIISYTSLMRGYANAKQYENAKETFREMSRRRLQVDRVALNVFVSVCAHSGDEQAADKVLQYMERSGGGISPTAQSYIPLVNLYARAENDDGVWAIYDRMRSQRVPVNDFTMDLVVDYILRVVVRRRGQTEDTEERLVERGGQVLRDGLQDAVSEKLLRRSKRKLVNAFSDELCRKHFGGLNTAEFRSASETIFERHGWNNIDSGWRVL